MKLEVRINIYKKLHKDIWQIGLKSRELDRTEKCARLPAMAKFPNVSLTQHQQREPKVPQKHLTFHRSSFPGQRCLNNTT